MDLKEYDTFYLKGSAVFNLVVMGTMSSGKSTLINSFIGDSLIPSLQQATTARALSILDNDKLDQPIAHIINNEGRYRRENKNILEYVKQFNDYDEGIRDLFIECNIRNIHNAKTALCIKDLPGPNNNSDPLHEKITKQALENTANGMILYVLNARAIGTYDDKEILRMVYEKVSNNNQLYVVFALNQYDAIKKSEKHETFLAKTLDLITDIGFENPLLIPTNAYIALLARKVLSNGALCLYEEEEIDIESFYHKIRDKDFSDARDMILNKENLNAEPIIIRDKEMERDKFMRMIECTGIPTLERIIEKVMLQTAKGSVPRILKHARGRKL